MKTKPVLWRLALVALFLATIKSQLSTAQAQGTAFTYQGRLDASGSSVNGIYDLRFAAFDAITNGNLASPVVTSNGIPVTNGLFTITLDFGSGAFTGADRWLQIAVRTNGGGAFITLAPRQPMTAAPYAVTSGNLTGGLAAGQLTGVIAPANIGAGTISSTMLAPGSVTASQLAAGSITTSNLADGAVSLDKLTTIMAAPLSLTILNPTPVSYESLGSAVAAVGTDKLLIGAAGYTIGAASAVGTAYLFGTDGKLLTTFTNPTPAAFDFFGSAVTSVGTDKVLIGAFFDHTGAIEAGAAYLFSTNGTLLTTFTNPTPAFEDSFGYSMAVVGADKVLIGATGDHSGGNVGGAAYLFSTNGTLLTTFTNPTPANADAFGSAVAAVGTDKVLIGASGDDTGATNSGAAYLFNTNGTLLTTFTNPTPANADAFGSAVAAVGTDKVLIGASGDDTGATDSGATYLFSTNGTLLTTFTNPTPASGDQFGNVVAAVGTDKVLIGASVDDAGATNSGAAYLFSTNGTLLTTFTNPTPASGDQFGITVAVVGMDRVIVGAEYDSTGASGAGAAYLFNLDGAYVPGLISARVVDGSITAGNLDPSIGVWSKSGSNLYYNAGKVGIGTATPIADLHIQGGTGGGSIIVSPGAANSRSSIQLSENAALNAGWILRDDGNVANNPVQFIGVTGGAETAPLVTILRTGIQGAVGLGRTPAANLLEVEGNVSKTVAGSWLANSDARIKQDIQPVHSALETLTKVRPVSFRYTDDYRAHHHSVEDRRYLNVVAQEFREVFPDDVKSSGEKLPDGSEILQVDSYPLTIYSVAAIQELNQKLTNELNRRDAENAELKQRLEKLEQLVHQKHDSKE